LAVRILTEEDPTTVAGSCVAKNLAGFNRYFRFTQQKHICAATTQEAPRRWKNITIKINENYESNIEV
jgi:hypothetical protein